MKNLKTTNLKPSTAPQPRPPILRFSPTAWAQLLCLRDAGQTEVGGFGVTAAGDPLRVAEVRLVPQTCTAVSVAFDDQAVADYFDDQVDQGRRPDEFARIWIHTHPGNSAQPSSTDEATFARVFGRADWAVMFILAMGGQWYARLRFNVGPGGELVIPVEVDYRQAFGGSNEEAWLAEHARCVQVPPPKPQRLESDRLFSAREPRHPLDEARDPLEPPADWYDDWFEYSHGYQPKDFHDDDFYGYR